MRTSHWLSATYRRLSRRERLFVIGGVTISAAMAIVVLGAIPFARRWGEREASIAAKAEQSARLRTLLDAEDELRAALAKLRDARTRKGVRLFTGTTPTLAASGLQTLLKRYADESHATLERVDLGGEAKAAQDGLTPIPAQLIAQGDIYGLVDLLSRLQHGQRLTVIDELRVNAGSESREASAQLSWSIRVHGLYAPEEGGSGP